ncbi:MAG: VTT domain-containing protein [Nanobdellota archaeon]
MKRKRFYLVLSFILLWTVLAFAFGDYVVEELLNVWNGYIIMLVVASLGGFSVFTSASYFTTLILLVSNGLNPLLLGLAGGVGITIGDSFFFYLGYTGREACNTPLRKRIQQVSHFIRYKYAWAVPIFVFVYACIAPMPNDIMTVSLGLVKYPYRKILVPLLLGNIVFTTVFALMFAW